MFTNRLDWMLSGTEVRQRWLWGKLIGGFGCFWVKFSGAVLVSLRGTQVSQQTINVSVTESLFLTGWLPPVSARCLSQAAVRPEPTTDENEAFNPTFVNRNPRNLEQMALAVKDRGWKTTWPHQQFYHRWEEIYIEAWKLWNYNNFYLAII